MIFIWKLCSTCTLLFTFSDETKQVQKQEEEKELKQKQQNIENEKLMESQLVYDNNRSGSIENLNNSWN